MMWEAQPPFHAVFVYGTGKDQTVNKLPIRETFLESLADIDNASKLGETGLDFIRNGNGASILPSKVRPPPPPKTPKTRQSK